MPDPKENYGRFINDCKGRVKRNELMSAHTTFRTGGNADLFIDVSDTDSLSQAIALAQANSIKYFVIGEGSNLLISDSGYRGLIIRNRIQGKEVKGNDIIIGGGELLNRIVDFSAECSLTGLEFAAGIWGTIGGAVYGNAGAYGSDVGKIVKEIEIMNNDGQLRREKKEYFSFSYRHSKLKETKEIVTRVRFGLASGEQKDIVNEIGRIRKNREGKHPVEPLSIGCFFKNVEDASSPFGKLAAGKLLEEIGAKEMKIGGAGVFEKHANIIVNKGNASSQDIRMLADKLKIEVKKKFKIDLQEEVVCLGDF